MVEREINLLSSLPRSKRDIGKRSEEKTPEVIAISKKFDRDYWDGDRKYGYGGYYYDGRWRPVAKDIIKFFNLKPGMKILDVGCGKAFLLYDLLVEGMNVSGLDISSYALRHSPYRVRRKLQVGTADALPYKDKAFDLVLSINALHNLPHPRCVAALQEIERVGKQAYIVVDSYHTPEEKELFESWVLTAETHGYPSEWLEIFKQAGYTGNYSWNVL